MSSRHDLWGRWASPGDGIRVGHGESLNVIFWKAASRSIRYRVMRAPDLNLRRVRWFVSSRAAGGRMPLPFESATKVKVEHCAFCATLGDFCAGILRFYLSARNKLHM